MRISIASFKQKRMKMKKNNIFFYSNNNEKNVSFEILIKNRLKLTRKVATKEWDVNWTSVVNELKDR